jgi:hypothetical protein
VFALVSALFIRIAHSQCEDFDSSKFDGSNEADFCKYKIANGKPLKVGDVCMAHPEDLSPTQVAFGEVAAACKRMKLEEKAAKKDNGLRNYLQSHAAPAVLGPEGGIYIVDHHHLAHALLQAFLPYDDPRQHRALFVCVTKDLGNATTNGFWDAMQREQLTWLHDERGQQITAKDLPTSLKYLRDDPYRTLAELSRESFGFVKCGDASVNKLFPQCSGGVAAKPFIEFRWANQYRSKFTNKDIYTESDQEQMRFFTSQFKDILKYSLSAENKDLEGWNQKQYIDQVGIDARGCIEETKSSVLV